jgi:predicted nucleic acid-binding protein
VSRVLLDTGPLVALLSEREARHSWVKAQFAQWRAPCVTCEPVLTEAFHLLAKVRGGAAALRAALHEGLVVLDFDLRSELVAVLDLMNRYESVPMSLADACLVRMAELTPFAPVFTLDEDFRIYRKNRTEPIEAIAPFA